MNQIAILYCFQTDFVLPNKELYVRFNFQVLNKLYDFSHMQEDQEDLRLRLAEYKGEHQALDSLINSAISSNKPINLLHMQQLKKKKLWLKDMIQKLESSLIDDIIA